MEESRLQVLILLFVEPYLTKEELNLPVQILFCIKRLILVSLVYILIQIYFSLSQRKGLETSFKFHKYVTKPERRKLAETLRLTENQVNINKVQ